MSVIRAGFYAWSYNGGNFLVSLRPSGVFYCPQYPAMASFAVDGNNILIDWKGFGKYALGLSSDGSLQGSAVGNPSNWRKMDFLRDFTAEERLILGNGGGSVWNFEWERGSFEVEFRCDGFNHFVCNSFPAHSHWTMDNNRVTINWDQYGIYELEVDALSGKMAGSKQGQPENWRRAQFLKPLDTDSIESIPPHDHSHKHDEHCGHH